MSVTDQGLTSADSARKTTGVPAPADALGEPKRMCQLEADSKESYECPVCGKELSTEAGRNQHVSKVHGRPYQNRDWLLEEYVEKGRSTHDIADQFDVTPQAIHKRLREHDIERRSTAATRIEKTPAELKDSEKLAELFDEHESARAIAEELGVAHDTVCRWAEKHDIDRRGVGGLPGEQNPRWNGGGADYYGENWHQKRREARERDENTCQICGYEPGADEPALDVHHIKPIRTFEVPEEANTLDNLITLCRQCHVRWEGIPLRPEIADS